jgi:general secretion pathway protein G
MKEKSMSGSSQVRRWQERRRNFNPSKAGFTLVEMLVVLAIMGLLVGLVAPRVFNQLADAKVRTAKIQVENLKNALDLFALDMDRYPSSAEGLNALIARPAGSGSWNGPYLKASALPRDPWNNAYVYRAPGESGRPFEISSLGPHGHEGGGGGLPEIRSW